jgi:hypothetical protein
LVNVYIIIENVYITEEYLEVLSPNGSEQLAVIGGRREKNSEEPETERR